MRIGNTAIAQTPVRDREQHRRLIELDEAICPPVREGDHGSEDAVGAHPVAHRLPFLAAARFGDVGFAREQIARKAQPQPKLGYVRPSHQVR